MLRRMASILPLRRPASPIVLLYHRIADSRSDAFRMNVSPQNFAEQLDVLREQTAVTRLDDIVTAMERRPTQARVAVTFDDAYVDNLTHAKPLLERADVCATVFSTAAFGAEFWWDTLERVLLGPDRLPAELELRIGPAAHEFKLAELTTRRRRHLPIRVRIRGEKPAAHGLLRRLHPLLRAAPPPERDRALAELATWAGPGADGPSHRAMTAPELARLVDGGSVVVGGHTASHPRLAQLTPLQQRDEVKSGRQAVEHAIGAPIHSFAYPFGQHGDYDATTAGIVRDLGFDHACCAFPGRVASARSRFELPRFWVEDWDGEGFARRLRRWLRG